MDKISIIGAKEHNLKDVDLEIPKNKLVVVTGVSGSGKSSLAFDTIYAEGQRRYVESLSAYARQFLEVMQKPDVDSIEGLSPAISIEQKTTSKNPRSTVGTITEIYDYMRLLFARIGIPYSPKTGKPIESQSVSQIVDNILKLNRGTIISENPEKYGTYSVDDSTGIHLIITDANDETIEYYVFGRSKSDYSHCYIRIGSDPKVYLADQNVIHMLSTRDSYWGEKPKDEILPPIPADSTIIN